MKVCLSSTGVNLEAQIDTRFGRCRYFLFVDTDSMEVEAVDNANIASAGGAGIRSAQLIADKGAEVLLTGNVGPNAFDVLNAAGIKIYSGLSGSVKEVLEKLKTGELNETTGPDVGNKFGFGGNK
jgi:predicted Fe-Mo cluster-binding NifX family protein